MIISEILDNLVNKHLIDKKKRHLHVTKARNQINEELLMLLPPPRIVGPDDSSYDSGFNDAINQMLQNIQKSFK